MAPVSVTEDYYMVLGVEHTATPELVTRSYRRLALKLHPDRNTKHDATEAFSTAYETLKDETKRREYDFIYPTIIRSTPSSQTRPPPTSTPRSAPSEAAQIAALEKSKLERSAKWRAERNVFDSLIFEIQRDVRKLEQEIKNLDSIAAAEAAVEAQKNSWGAWLLSPIYKKVEDTEEERERKDRGRQERKIEKDFKERKLVSKKEDLKQVENLLQNGKEKVDSANLVDTGKITAIQGRIRARQERERQERERVERERTARVRKQQQEQREKEAQEAAEAWKKQRAEERAAAQKRQERERVEIERAARVWKQEQEQREKEAREAEKAWEKQRAKERAAAQKRQEEEDRRWQKIVDEETKANCYHDVWWTEVQGRTACPRCSDIWNYLLQCPTCMRKACPKCQSELRPRYSRHRARRAPVRAPSPDFTSHYYYDDY